ncbi:MAG: hypothetical protein ACC612_11300 [Methanomethylovorans sp.]
MAILRSFTTAVLMVLAFFSLFPVLGPALIVPLLLKLTGGDE